ncbi:MAG: imidazolonepropionase, partial [Acidimicrobiales bacterium]
MLVDRIGLLVTNQPELGEGPLGLLRGAAVVIEGGWVVWVGPEGRAPEGASGPRLDAGGRCV